MNITKAVFQSRQCVWSTLHKMGLLFLMYLSQKIFLCFSWVLLPIILRKQGISLGAIGFTALVHSPWALKFLYAFMVDRFYSTRMGRRKSWVVPLLMVSLFMLPCIAQLSPQEDLRLLLSAVFVLNFIFATVDIAVDGYATDILKPDERPWGNTVQIGGYVIGYMIGSGVFLIIYQQQGWRNTLMIIAALQLLIMVPIVIHKEMPPVFREESGHNGLKGWGLKLNAWEFINQPQNLFFLLFAGLIALFDRGGSQLRLPMVTDMGIEPVVLGKLNIWFSSPMCLFGAVMGGTLLRKLGNQKILVLGCLIAAGVNFFSAIVSQCPSSGWLSIGIMMGSEKLMGGIISILISNMIMTLSVGSQSATHYAILCSLVSLFGMGANPLMGKLCDGAGYFNYYMGLGVSNILIIFVGTVLLRRIPNLAK